MTMVKTPLVTRTETRRITSTTIVIDFAPRCSKCGGVIAYQATRPWVIKCTRGSCNTITHGDSQTV